MRTVAKYLVVLVFGALLFGAGAVVFALRSARMPIATIQIENRSCQVLRALEVKYDGFAVHGVAALPALAPDEIIRFPFYVLGEGGYKVSAVLADGTIPKAGEGYVEPGYDVTEVITSAGIGPMQSHGVGCGSAAPATGVR